MPAAWSSMPVPRKMLNQSVTITPYTGTQESSGAWDLTAGTAVTVMGSLQPASSTDAMIYMRETTRTLYTLFLAPTTTTGAATADSISKVSTATVGGVVYKFAGDGLDLVSHGAVLQCGVYREA